MIKISLGYLYVWVESGNDLVWFDIGLIVLKEFLLNYILYAEVDSFIISVRFY